MLFLNGCWLHWVVECDRRRKLKSRRMHLEICATSEPQEPRRVSIRGNYSKRSKQPFIVKKTWLGNWLFQTLEEWYIVTSSAVWTDSGFKSRGMELNRHGRQKIFHVQELGILNLACVDLNENVTLQTKLRCKRQANIVYISVGRIDQLSSTRSVNTVEPHT